MLQHLLWDTGKQCNNMGQRFVVGVRATYKALSSYCLNFKQTSCTALLSYCLVEKLWQIGCISIGHIGVELELELKTKLRQATFPYDVFSVIFHTKL